MNSRVERAPGSAAPDRIILWVATALLGFGAVLVFSASSHLAAEYYNRPLLFFIKQSVFFFVGVAVLIGVSRVPYTFWQRTYRIWLLLGAVLLVAVLFSAEVRGARRWLSIGPFGLHPAEVFRFGVILFLAAMLSRRRRQEPTFKKHTLPHLALLGFGGVLLMLQPDFGSVVLLAATVFSMLYVAGTPIRHLALTTIPAVLLAVLVVFGFGYKRHRLDNYVDGLRDPFEAGYQVKQALIFMGDGGLFGKGLGGGNAKFLYVPDAHTDFILASIGEELGFIVLVIMLSAYALLLLRGLRIASRAPDRFSSLLVAGLIISLGLQAALNISVVLGLVPPTGLPLPLLSYGGTSVLFTTPALAIVLNVSRHVQR